MPKINWPTEDERKNYITKLRDKLKTLPSEQYKGFFPIDESGKSKRAVAFDRLSRVLNNYISYAPNGLSKDDRTRLIKPGTATDLSQAQLFRPEDEQLAHLLDLKHVLESTAENGKTHFENLMDYAYASNVPENYLQDGVKAMSEDLCMDLKVPELQLKRVPNPSLQNRDTEKKNGLEWISEFKADAQRAAAAGGKERDTDWIINTLAVRSLVDSERHKSDNLKGRRLSPNEITDRANRLMAVPGIRGYIDRLKKNPQEYNHAVELLLKGNGGRLEDHLNVYLVASKQVPFSALGTRYRPTAKQMIELMQGTLNNPDSSQEQKEEALASIIAVRKTMGIKRATMGLVGDDTLKLKIGNYSGFLRNAERAAKALEELNPLERSKLLSEARNGHGGSMVKSFDKMLERHQLNPLPSKAEPERAQSVPGRS